MKLLRQNTATIIHVGPVLGTDFLTLQTSASMSSGRADLFQAGAGVSIDIGGRTWTHIAGGVYAFSLLSGDLAVLGPLQINIRIPSTQPFAVHGNVLTQSAYDALCGGGNMPSDIQRVFGSANAASNLQQGANGMVPVTVGNGGTTTTVPTNLTSAVSGFYAGRTLVFITGALAGQAVAISGYNGATKQLTVTALTAAPSNGDTALIV